MLAPAPVSEQVVVSATRGEATLSSIGVAADVLDRERIDDRAAPSLLALLQDVPGVATARAGQSGLQASVFVRGGESRYAAVLVDGVPVNQPGGAFDFGTALPFELERVEVVRGAASSLYGNDALAGVVSLADPAGAPGRVALPPRGGRGRLASTGSAGSAPPSGAPRPLRLERGRAAARPPTTASPTAASSRRRPRCPPGRGSTRGPTLRAVVRFDDSTTGTPGPTAFGRPDLDASFEREDLVVSASVRRAEAPGATARTKHLSQQLSLGLRAHRPALPEPGRLGPLGPGVGGHDGELPALRLPERGGLPEPDGAAHRRVPGGLVGRHPSPADRGGRGRPRDGRARATAPRSS